MIIGALGTVERLLEDLRGIPKLSKGVVDGVTMSDTIFFFILIFQPTLTLHCWW